MLQDDEPALSYYTGFTNQNTAAGKTFGPLHDTDNTEFLEALLQENIATT